MMGNLGILTKAYLMWNAWCDAQTDQFQTAHYPFADGGEDTYVISHFVTERLRCYERQRTRYQIRRPSFFWTPLAGYFLWSYKLRGLDGAIADMNSAVEKIQGDILAVYVEYSRSRRQFVRQIERYRQEDASHYAVMEEKKANKVTKKYIAKERRRYLAAINVLKRKINLIHKAQGALAVRQQNFFLQIAVYYRYAAKWNNGLPVQYMGDDRFAQIANISTTSPYEEALQDAQDKLYIYSEQLGQLFSRE